MGVFHVVLPTLIFSCCRVQARMLAVLIDCCIRS